MIKIFSCIKQFLMRFTIRERKKKELKKYIEEVSRFQRMSKSELDMEYVNAKTDYMHKKIVLLFFLTVILVSVLMNVWKLLFSFIEDTLKYSPSGVVDEADLMKVSIVIFVLVVVFISCIIIGIIVSYIRSIKMTYRNLVIIEEVRK